MATKQSISARWKNTEPSKKFVFWACVATAALTVFIGFKWGGWVTGGSAQEMAAAAASEARIEIAVAGCVDRFGKGQDSRERLAALRKVDSWMRGSYLEEAGWVTPRGMDSPVGNAGGRCATQIIDDNSPAAGMAN